MRKALIEYEPGRVTPGQLRETLTDLGYTIRDSDKLRAFEEQEEELERARLSLLTAAGYTAVALGAMVLMWFKWLEPAGAAALYWLMPTLALAMIFVPGWHILEMAWASLRRGILNQHVLLEFGAFAGLLGGFLGYVFPSFPLFDLQELAPNAKVSHNVKLIGR